MKPFGFESSRVDVRKFSRWYAPSSPSEKRVTKRQSNKFGRREGGDAVRRFLNEFS